MTLDVVDVDQTGRGPARMETGLSDREILSWVMSRVRPGSLPKDPQVPKPITIAGDGYFIIPENKYKTLLLQKMLHGLEYKDGGFL